MADEMPSGLIWNRLSRIDNCADAHTDIRFKTSWVLRLQTHRNRRNPECIILRGVVGSGLFTFILVLADFSAGGQKTASDFRHMQVLA